MPDIKAGSRGSGDISSRSPAYAVLAVVLGCFGLYAALVAGPATRATTHESVMQAVVEEDHRFCEMFGMRSGTDAFAACSRELSIVRQRQLDRDNAAAQGIL
jgi:hypothetical protein